MSASRLFWSSLILAALLGTATTAMAQSSLSPFEEVIERSCTKCHDRGRIDRALAEKQDFGEIVALMIKRGAILSNQDKEILGTFAGNPLNTEISPELKPGGYAEFQHIINSRCTLCHSRQRIDSAIEQGLEYQSIEAMMLKRGAVLSERDRRVLGTFWGQPLKK